MEIQDINIKDGNVFTKLCPFPVGFIYMSSVNVSPASLYGGTWFKVEDNRFWLPATNYGESSGSNFITIGNMPSHNHSGSTGTQSNNHYHTIQNEMLVWEDNSGNPNKGMVRWTPGTSGWTSNRMLGPNSNQYRAITTGKESANHTHAITINNTGNGYAYWQPYRTCHCWIRTA